MSPSWHFLIVMSLLLQDTIALPVHISQFTLYNPYITKKDDVPELNLYHKVSDYNFYNLELGKGCMIMTTKYPLKPWQLS